MPPTNSCKNNCNIRNSTCGIFPFDPFAPVCGCFYCNFDSKSKKCIGQCKYSNIEAPTTCINRVKTPKSDVDCYCASLCSAPINIKGKPVCKGTCGLSGLKCKPFINSLAFTTVDACTCQ